jgi:hypothetical protein
VSRALVIRMLSRITCQRSRAFLARFARSATLVAHLSPQTTGSQPDSFGSQPPASSHSQAAELFLDLDDAEAIALVRRLLRYSRLQALEESFRD